MTYSKDLRQRVLKFVKKGNSCRKAGYHYEVNHQTVCNWVKNPVAKKAGPKSAHKINDNLLKIQIELHPDAYLSEYASHFNMSISGIWYAMKRLGITRKKNVDVQGR
jgi:transposase